MGLASAYHLKRMEPGLSVTLAEKSARICSGNSGRSAALYRNLFSSSASRQLAESSIAHYGQIAGAVSLKPIGYLWTFDGPSWKALGNEALAVSTLALETEILEGDELRAALAPREPSSAFPDAAGALLGRNCGALSAQALASWYAQRFAELGGKLLTGLAALSFKLGPDGAGGARARSATMSDGCEIEADAFLAAAGCWTQDLLGPVGIASSVYPKKRQLFGVSVPDPAMIFGSARQRPAVILPNGVYLKPILERGLVLAGRADGLGRAFESAYDPVSAKPPAEEAYFRESVEPVLRAYFPKLADAFPAGLKLMQSWAGHYDYHWPDKNPVIEREANIVWAAGSSGSGIMKGDAIGRIAAAAILGRETATLADGSAFRVADLSLRTRSVERERLVL